MFYPFHIFPLLVLKQIVTMFLSKHDWPAETGLARFVLARDAKYLDPKFRFFVYYNLVGFMRSIGLAASGNGLTGKFTLMSEISYPPFGYLMTIESPPPDDRLTEITHFSRYDYSEFRVMGMRLPVLPTYWPYPGVYSEKKDVLKESAPNMS